MSQYFIFILFSESAGWYQGFPRVSAHTNVLGDVIKCLLFTENNGTSDILGSKR